MSAEFRGTRCYVTWRANLKGRLNLLSASHRGWRSQVAVWKFDSLKGLSLLTRGLECERLTPRSIIICLSVLLGGKLPRFAVAQHPAHRVAVEDVEQHLEVVVRPLLRGTELRDVPAPHLARPRRQELGASMIAFALKSSRSSRAFSRASFSICTCSALLLLGPRFLSSARSAPSSRCLRHALRCELHSPSRLRMAPLRCGFRSTSSRIFNLYEALKRRGLAFSTT